MKDHDDKVDAVAYSFSEMTKIHKEKVKKAERIFESIDAYKKFSAMAIGMMYGAVASAGTPFWIVVVCALTAILAVNVAWHLISKWGTARLGLDG